MKNLLLPRMRQDSYSTLGSFVAEDGTEVCLTMEKPWQDNQPDVSCIPAGTYTLNLRWSDHFGRPMYHVDGVPGRSGVEVHAANKPSELHGCIATGLAYSGGDIAGGTSQAGLQKFLTYMNDEDGILTITDPKENV